MNISNSKNQIKSSISNFKEEIVTFDELLKEQQQNKEWFERVFKLFLKKIDKTDKSTQTGAEYSLK